MIYIELENMVRYISITQ